MCGHKSGRFSGSFCEEAAGQKRSRAARRPIKMSALDANQTGNYGSLGIKLAGSLEGNLGPTCRIIYLGKTCLTKQPKSPLP